TRPGLRRIWRANADAVGAAKGYAPPFRTAITRRLRSSPACAFAASWRRRPSTGRSTRPRSRNGWKNVSSPPLSKGDIVVMPYLNTYFFQAIDFAGNLAKFGATWHYASENRIFALYIGVCAAFVTRFE